ncbi:MAG: YihY/virulence factor BrkB family protein [Lachnospiraceae bacterium]|nr:YihY/virulence factor BrkB family protein [Lachnospiraceae bacterium]
MIKKIWNEIFKFVGRIMDDHIGAYAAQSAYFVMLSFIPVLLLLLTLTRYLPFSRGDLTEAIINSVPDSFESLLRVIISEVYAKSLAVVPVSAVVALWSAGKGFMALSNGLNVINDVKETRNYFYMRIRSTIYTIFFIVAIVLTLILLVFGRSIQNLLVSRWPFVLEVTDFILRFSTIITMFVLAVAFLLFYTFLPNRRMKIKDQLPGALLTSVAWAAFSFGFSLYFDHYSGFADMYGSLTTILMIMLWLYICMYLFLIGAEVNVILEEDFQERFSVVWDEVNDLKAAALKEKKDLTDKSDMIK